MIGAVLSLPSLGLIFILTGCAAAVVSGGGGYDAGKSGRPVGEVNRDTTITSTINARYVHDDLVSAFDVRVETYRGSVTLSGRVSSRQAAQRAVELARTVEGVSRVVSQLTVVVE